jgi:Gpi18-like mannosyltransferase
LHYVNVLQEPLINYAPVGQTTARYGSNPAIGSGEMCESSQLMNLIPNKRSVSILIWVIIAAITVRLLLAPTGGYDLPAFKLWQAYIAKFGLSHAYALGSPEVGYPPVYPYVLEVVAFFYRPGFPLQVQAGWSSILMKMPMLFADFAIGWLIYSAIRGQRVPRRFATLGFASYVLNPGVIVNSAYWGGVDSLMGLPAFAAVLAATNGRAIIASILICLAILMKYQAAILLPLIAMIILRRDGLRGLIKGSVAGLIATVSIYLPFIASDDLGRSISSTFGSAVGIFFPLLTVHAHNVWWVISLAKGSPYVGDNAKVLGLFSIRSLALLVLGMIVLFISVFTFLRYRPGDSRGVKRTEWLPFAYAAVLGLAFFEIPTEVHENYFYLACLFSAVVAWTSRRFYAAFWISSIGWTANMLLMDPGVTSTLYSVLAAGIGPPWRQILRLVYCPSRATTVANISAATILNAAIIAIATLIMLIALLRLAARKKNAEAMACPK